MIEFRDGSNKHILTWVELSCVELSIGDEKAFWNQPMIWLKESLSIINISVQYFPQLIYLFKMHIFYNHKQILKEEPDDQRIISAIYCSFITANLANARKNGFIRKYQLCIISYLGDNRNISTILER